MAIRGPPEEAGRGHLRRTDGPRTPALSAPQPLGQGEAMSPAAQASDANVMGSLTQKIAQIMTAPDTINPGAGPGAAFIAFCSPGIAIAGSDLAFGDMTTKPEINANSAFSQMVNNVPSSTGFWGLTNKKIWDIYEDAITQVTLPTTTITSQQQSELDRAQANLAQKVGKIGRAHV